MGTPISQPTPPGFVHTPRGYLTTQTLTLDTLASGAGTPPSPWYFPPRKKLPKKKALSEVLELSVFDILNTFQHHWFLSVAHLRAQAQKAQKANNRKSFWVKFAPQFHTHLVKCAVALVS
jgi:hypothetical protein